MTYLRKTEFRARILLLVQLASLASTTTIRLMAKES